jgi:hypothetical protein
MKKKKETIELTKENITFEYNNQNVQALIYYPNDKKIEILYLHEKRKELIAFIHIPKNIKKIINPF